MVKPTYLLGALALSPTILAGSSKFHLSKGCTGGYKKFTFGDYDKCKNAPSLTKSVFTTEGAAGDYVVAYKEAGCETETCSFKLEELQCCSAAKISSAELVFGTTLVMTRGEEQEEEDSEDRFVQLSDGSSYPLGPGNITITANELQGILSEGGRPQLSEEIMADLLNAGWVA